MTNARREIVRFLIVGLTAAVLDFSLYRLVLWIGDSVSLAKTCGFIAGTVFAFFLNRLWTFSKTVEPVSTRELTRFAAIYGLSLIANVGTNSLVLSLFGKSEIIIWAGFILATALSATLNFLGLKFLVFGDDRAQPRSNRMRKN